MKPTVVALHGNGGSRFRFAQVVLLLEDRLDFHPLTLPGFGGTPISASIRSIGDYARWLEPILQTFSPPVVVLGTGIGGSVALELAQQPANDLAGLILHTPVGAHLEQRWLPWLMSAPWVQRLGQQMIATRWLRPLWQRLFFKHPIPPKHLEQFFEDYRNCAVFGQMFDWITPAWFAALRPQPIPTALLWGGQERMLSPQQLTAFQQLLPNHIVHIEPEWRHFPMLEQPAAYAAIISSLVKQLLPPSGGKPHPFMEKS
ncbi:MAG: alpha/beta fold hydrolase [Anaerolineales bacterium]|nr:alpha/beta fold hydrolase [Anaerolineales bacterium]